MKLSKNKLKLVFLLNLFLSYTFLSEVQQKN